MIIDFITTEYVVKMGGYEKSPLLKYFAGQPINHSIIRIIGIFFIFLIIAGIDKLFAGTYLPLVIALVFLITNIIIIFVQKNNINIILKLNRQNRI